MIDRLATRVSNAVGSTWGICFAFLLVVVWAPTFYVIHDVDTWQLIINTATTIVTFLMVFFIQRAQNRDTCEIKAASQEIKASIQVLIEALHLEQERDERMEDDPAT